MSEKEKQAGDGMQSQENVSVQIIHGNPEVWDALIAKDNANPHANLLAPGEVRKNGLEDHSVAELRELAGERDIEGRSKMNGDELKEVLYEQGVGVTQAGSAEVWSDIIAQD